MAAAVAPIQPNISQAGQPHICPIRQSTAADGMARISKSQISPERLKAEVPTR
jgi:hypothetical protein